MKETGKEGRLNAFLGKAFLLFAAAMVMLCIHPLTAYAAKSGYDWQLDDEGHLTIESDDGMEDWSYDAANGAKADVKIVTVSEGVTRIFGNGNSDADRPFAGCTSLQAVTLPASLETIEERSFYGCTNLASVTMLGETPPTLGDGSGSDDVFSDTALNTTDKQIYVPESSIAAYKASWTQWKDYIHGGDDESENPPPEENPPEENPGGDDDPPTADSVRNIDPTTEDYVDTTIDVQGFTEDVTIYSVDVEWGAMTFQYENAKWDATTHKTVPGAGWRVYDSANNKALDTRTDAINRIQVTNHSDADVWATLAYTGAGNYTDTSGSFEKEAADGNTNYDAAGKILSLATADNGTDGAAGTPTVGTVYFMPSGIKEEYKKAAGITKWSQLGTITVGILTEHP